MKIVRLNENDIEKLVKKIISEEKKSVNEVGVFDWVRSKRFSDEEEGRAILKGIKTGEVSSIYPHSTNREKGFNFELGGHKIFVVYSSYVAAEIYELKVDGESMDVSDSIIRKIMGEIGAIHSEPRKQKKNRIKNSLSRYNLPNEERSKIEDTDSIFNSLDNQ